MIMMIVEKRWNIFLSFNSKDQYQNENTILMPEFYQMRCLIVLNFP